MKVSVVFTSLLLLSLTFLSVNSIETASSSSISYAGTDLSIKFFKVCLIAYCETDKIQNWTCGSMCDSIKNISDVTIVNQLEAKDKYYISYDNAENTIILAFRGTFPLFYQNLLMDIEVNQIPYPNCDQCAVSQGWYNNWLQMKESVTDNLKTYTQKYPNASLAVIGYSSGASISTFAAIDLFLEGFKINYFYTFGSPRVGNKRFAQWFDTLNFSGYSARIVNHNDIFVHYPFEWLDYEHINTEIWYYNNKPDGFKLCTKNEDESCSDSVSILDWSFQDHLSYQGVDVYSNIVKCGFKQE